jgi:hypothetical protein
MNYNYEDYVVKSIDTTKFLTTSPITYTVKDNSKCYLNCYLANSAVFDARLAIKTKYDLFFESFPTGSTKTTDIYSLGVGVNNIENNTNLIGDDGTYFASSFLPVFKNKSLQCTNIATVGASAPYSTLRLTVGSGHGFQSGEKVDVTNFSLLSDTRNIIGTGATTIDIGAISLLVPLNINPSNTYVEQITENYEIYIWDATNEQKISETRTFNIDKTCNKFENIQLIFQDRLGSMIPFNFELQNYKTINISRNEYMSKFGDIQNPALPSAKFFYNSFDKGRTQYNIIEVEQLQVNTDFITEEYSHFLRELFTSPAVYIIENNFLYPVLVREESFRDLTKHNQKLIQHTLLIEYSNNNKING